jgi:hypothetical protein
MRVLFWFFLALTLALYLVMVLWSLPLISVEADGLMPFDLRPFGYSPDEAEAFLNALSEEGRAFYADTQHALDAAFPGLLAVVTGWAALWLFRGPAGAVLAVLAVGAAASDYMENAAVARLLEGFSPGEAMAASRWTIAKSAGATVVYAALLFGLIRAGWRRLRG